MLAYIFVSLLVPLRPFPVCHALVIRHEGALGVPSTTSSGVTQARKMSSRRCPAWCSPLSTVVRFDNPSAVNVKQH